MEHEVFVPVHVDRLREALSDPERVARAVPGLQHDAGTPPVAGRLKVRAAGHTITYRGALRVTASDDGSYTVEGDATEVRGSGSVRFGLTIRLTPAPEGTTLHFDGTATADGRVTELPPDAVTAAVGRLLGRFAEKLGEGVAAEEGRAAEEQAAGEREAEEPEEAAPVTEAAGVSDGAEEEPAPGTEASAVSDGAEKEEPSPNGTEAPEAPDGTETEPKAESGGGVDEVEDAPSASVFETEVPPPSLDPFVEDDFSARGEPPAEAAHARRTMIGRSAEEVDHAPPRGRYAPVPAPETVSAGTALRWAAPAAALAVASAVIVARALRRRR